MMNGIKRSWCTTGWKLGVGLRVDLVLSRSIWRKPPERVGGASALADTAVGDAPSQASGNTAPQLEHLFKTADAPYVGFPDGLAAFLDLPQEI
jgi:hypothetical protein